MAKKRRTAATKRRGTGKKTKARVLPRRSGKAKRNGVDEQLVERTVALLLEHDRRMVASKRKIGAHVLEEYFGGDEERARSRDRTKSASFARLAERAREDTLWDERDLREAVNIELTARSLPVQVADGIDASYLLMLDSVEDLEQRREVAARIARGDIKGDGAKAAIRSASGERRGGRKPVPPAVAGAYELARDGERLALDGVFEESELRKLDAAELEEVRLAVRAAFEHVVEFEEAVGRVARARHPGHGPGGALQ